MTYAMQQWPLSQIASLLGNVTRKSTVRDSTLWLSTMQTHIEINAESPNIKLDTVSLQRRTLT